MTAAPTSASGVAGPGGSMTVSVVIPTTGRAELARAVDSVLHQTVLPVEVIVADDALEPTPPAWGDAALPCDVRIERTGGRRGGGAARNLGISRTRGEIVALLDDDDWWQPDKPGGCRRRTSRSPGTCSSGAGCGRGRPA